MGDTITMEYVIIHLSKPTEYTSPRLNPKVNYGLCVIMMELWGFILGKKKQKQKQKRAIPVSEVDSREAVHVWGQRHMGNLCTSLSSFVVNLKLL